MNKKTSKMSKEMTMFLNEVSKVYNEGTKWYKWSTSGITPYLVGEKIVTFHKPTIETQFCFGYSTFGQGPTMEEMCKNKEMSKSSKWFINENLKSLNSKLDSLKDNSTKCYWCKNSKINTYYFEFESEWNRPWNNEVRNYITPKEKKELIKCLENEKTKFMKRLDTYLKKYGLSKLHTWSYCCDD